MAVVTVVTPESTLEILDSPSISGLLGGQCPSVTGHSILVRSQNTASGSSPCQEEQDQQSSKTQWTQSITSQLPEEASSRFMTSESCASWGENVIYVVKMYELWTVSHKPKRRTNWLTNLQTACCGREKKQLANWANTEETHSPGKVASEQRLSGNIKKTCAPMLLIKTELYSLPLPPQRMSLDVNWIKNRRADLVTEQNGRNQTRGKRGITRINRLLKESKKVY